MKIMTSFLDVDTVVNMILSAIEASNMRLVAHINGQANARNIGEYVPADQILEIFRPDFAVRVWQACKPAGYDIPLRIHVYDENSATKIAYRMPSETFKPYASDELMAISKELDVIFNQIISSALDTGDEI